MSRSSACGCSSSRSPCRRPSCISPAGHRCASSARSTLPRVAKKLLVLTLSLIETMLQAVDRARTALIARRHHHARALVAQPAPRLDSGADRVAHGDHDRDRPHARQVADRGHAARLDGALAARAAARLTAADFGWIALALAARRRSGCAECELIAGPNFSGRSAALMARLRETGPAFFVGPYAEAALSGLSSTVADEIEIYRSPSRCARRPSRRSISRPMRRASRRRCRAASRCCSRCIASRAPTTRRSGSTPRWSSSIRTIAIARSPTCRRAPHRASARSLIDNRLDRLGTGRCTN